MLYVVCRRCFCSLIPVCVSPNHGRGSVGYRSWFGRITVVSRSDTDREQGTKTALLHHRNSVPAQQ